MSKLDLKILLDSISDSEKAPFREQLIERDGARTQIKALSKRRKELPKDAYKLKAELSREIKSTKKSVRALESQLLALLDDQLNLAGKDVGETRRRYDGHINITDSIEGWHQFQELGLGSQYHQLEWREFFIKTMARETIYLSARDEQQDIIGVLPIAITRSKVFGNYGVSLPYLNYGGPVAIADNVEDMLIQYAFEQLQDWNIDYLEIRDTKLRSDLEPRTDKVAMVLDITQFKNFDDFMSKVGSKVRSQANKALGTGIKFRKGKKELLKDFYYVFSRNMRDLGTPVYDIAMFESILSRFENHSMLVVGYYENQPISAAFLLEHKNYWEIPWASTLRSANKISANMALYATILKEVFQRGGTHFDFGRSTKGASTYRFKKQWLAQSKQLYWYYSDSTYAKGLTTESPKYQLAIKLWQLLPVTIANIIGPTLAKNLP